MQIYELTPNDSHKSFYGKAYVRAEDDGTRVLESYRTDIVKMNHNGELTRLWNGWSATTGRHIAAFCGLNKREFMNLPMGK